MIVYFRLSLSYLIFFCFIFETLGVILEESNKKGFVGESWFVEEIETHTHTQREREREGGRKRGMEESVVESLITNIISAYRKMNRQLLIYIYPFIYFLLSHITKLPL